MRNSPYKFVFYWYAFFSQGSLKKKKNWAHSLTWHLLDISLLFYALETFTSRTIFSASWIFTRFLLTLGNISLTSVGYHWHFWPVSSAVVVSVSHAPQFSWILWGLVCREPKARFYILASYLRRYSRVLIQSDQRMRPAERHALRSACNFRVRSLQGRGANKYSRRTRS